MSGPNDTEYKKPLRFIKFKEDIAPKLKDAALALKDEGVQTAELARIPSEVAQAIGEFKSGLSKIFALGLDNDTHEILKAIGLQLDQIQRFFSNNEPKGTLKELDSAIDTIGAKLEELALKMQSGSPVIAVPLNIRELKETALTEFSSKIDNLEKEVSKLMSKVPHHPR